MRLVPKMTVVIVGAMTLVVGVYAIVSIGAHRRQLVEDTRVDNMVMARTLADGVATAVRYGGEEAGRELVDTVDRNNPDVSFAWFTPSRTITAGGIAPARPDAPDAPASDRGDWVTSEADVTSHARVRLGTVSIVDSLEDEEKIVAGRLLRILLLTVAMAVVGAGLAIALGRRYVAEPVRALCEHAARIGRGELGAPITVRGNDELAQLAAAMNDMARNLAESIRRARDESEARLAALEQLRHAERLATVGKLAAGVAHELGTPLNVVGARAAMIESGEESAEEVRRYGALIRDQTAKMTATIRQLLGFARARPAPREALDLPAATRRVCEMLRPLSDRRRVSVATRLGDASQVEGDAGQIDQVLTNVIINAVQACSAGGVVRIEIGRSESTAPPDVAPAPAGFVCVSVRDDGHGIHADDLARVFDPFFTTKDIGQGTGLGLSVAYGIVRDHGGWIDVRSDGTGSGSTFCVHLPAATGRLGAAQ